MLLTPIYGLFSVVSICTEDIPSENESFEHDNPQTHPGADYVMSCRSHLSGEQKERVIALVREIEPEISVYVAVMRKSHVHPRAPFVVSFTLLLLNNSSNSHEPSEHVTLDK
jgi:hypothetical protein